jgi:hypothetical protein
MTTTTRSAALVPVVPVFTNTERLALAGFLAGYSGLTHRGARLSGSGFSARLRGTPGWSDDLAGRRCQVRR